MGLTHSQFARDDLNSMSCLLTDPTSHIQDEEAALSGRILYEAEFEELENDYVNYDTVLWILISLPLILAWGVGIIMLLYLPLRRYILRKDIRSRMLCVTAHAIVYKVKRPMFFPCLGSTTTEKHVLLSRITDITLEQGCLQAIYGLHTIRVENLAHRKATSLDELQIQGVVDPKKLRKVILTEASKLQQETRLQCESMICDPCSTSKAISISKPAMDVAQTSHGVQSLDTMYFQGEWLGNTECRWQLRLKHVTYTPKASFGESSSLGARDMLVLKRLDEVERSVKRIESLMEGSSFSTESVHNH